MPQKLLSLYLRVGIGAARLAIKASSKALDVALSATGFVRPASDSHGPSSTAEWESDTPESRAAEADNGAQAAVEVEVTPREPEIDYDAEPPTPLAPEQERAKTIDDEPELVEEFAEPGAEDGAGAELQIEPPFDGYDRLHADELAARVADLSAEELAVVDLYERTHKNRQTVLRAAERRLKEISGPASR